MKPLHTLPLEQAGMTYIKEMLNEPGLCERVGKEDLSAGRVFGLVPEGTSLERASKFRTGGLVVLHGERLATPHVHEWMTGHLRASMASMPVATLIVQDAWMYPSDPHFHKAELARFANGRSIYFVVEKEDLNRATVDSAFHTPHGRAVAFLCNYRLPREVLRNHEAPDAVIDALAPRVTQVIGEAYDSESFVFWRKES